MYSYFWNVNGGKVHKKMCILYNQRDATYTRVGTLIVATIYLQLIQNRYSFEVLLSFIVVTSIVYNPLPAIWKS